MMLQNVINRRRGEIHYLSFDADRYRMFVEYRRWAGKTSYVYLAPEHVFTIKHLRGTE